MRRILIAAAVLALTAAFSVSSAEDIQQKTVSAAAVQEQEHEHTHKCRMKGDKGKKMPKPKLVATSDGGVIIMAGNTLMKYDTQLNLVKKTTVDLPLPKMCGKMMKKTGGCRKMKNAMDRMPEEKKE